MVPFYDLQSENGVGPILIVLELMHGMIDTDVSYQHPSHHHQYQMMHVWTRDVIKCRCKTRICLESLYHYFTEQDCKHSSIPLQVYTLSVRGSHHQRPEASYYPCHRWQSAVAEPPRSSSPAQTHERTLDSASS